MAYSHVVVSKKAAKRLRAGHLWVYSSEIVDVDGAGNGEIVAIVDARGRALGYGFYSQKSKISLRWVAPSQSHVDSGFWRQRLMDAIAYRERVVSRTDAYRLVFAESDLLPSLIIDRYGDHFVVQTLTPAMEVLKPMWVELLMELCAPRAIVERNDAKIRQLEGLRLQKGPLYGDTQAGLVVTMNGLRFQVDLLNGQKTGAFLDQRENYQTARQYAHGRALDCFCYTGGFALHVAGACTSVTAVDVSAPALMEARENAAINSVHNIEWVEANVFDYLRQLAKEGRRFETIILDPPAFAKSRDAVEGAIRGYKEINLRALQLLSTGGILITSTCSYHQSEEMFLGVLASAAADANRKIRLLEKRVQSRDHPILLSMPETYYLKCVILQVL